MLTEFLSGKDPKLVRWSGSMPGVRICQFQLDDPSGKMDPVPTAGAPFHFETVFCTGGRIAVQLAHGPSRMTEDQGVLLLSDVSYIRSFQISGDLKGILVSVDAKAARESLDTVCSTMGLVPHISRIRERMAGQLGCVSLRNTPWTRAMFHCLPSLPEETQGRYCVFKSVELLYLLCAEDPDAEHPRADLPGEGYVTQSIAEARAYMEAHLSEKLTIPDLCKMFSVSPTFLKREFRRIYGMPVHSWLVRQRMKRAQELLRSTDLNIQAVAQSVGCDGMSQFHAAFKQYSGVTPGQYRKMSKTAVLCPFL